MKGRKTTAWFVKVEEDFHSGQLEALAVGLPATVKERVADLHESHHLARWRRRLALEDLDETRDAAFARAIEKARAAQTEAEARLKQKKAALRALISERKKLGA